MWRSLYWKWFPHGIHTGETAETPLKFSSAHPDSLKSFVEVGKNTEPGGCQWLTLVILAMWEAEIGRTVVPGQSEQKKFVRSHFKWKNARHGGVCLSSQQQW
jgi:hypothetical protein